MISLQRTRDLKRSKFYQSSRLPIPGKAETVPTSPALKSSKPHLGSRALGAGWLFLFLFDGKNNINHVPVPSPVWSRWRPPSAPSDQDGDTHVIFRISLRHRPRSGAGFSISVSTDDQELLVVVVEGWAWTHTHRKQ